MNKTIEARGLTMKFGDVTALEDVSVTFGGNRIVGLLGRNGAGKSTLLNLLTNRLLPTSGEALIQGINVRENDRALEDIYVMGEKNLMPESTGVRQFFRWTRDFYPGFDMEYANALAEKFGLDTRKKLKSLSTGYLTIAKIIAALATDVPFLLLDEPVLGLDANHRELFYRLLLENYGEKPRTILVSTHLIEEISDMVEQIVILKAGRLLLDKPAEELRRMGYAVSGKAADVDAYCAGRRVLSVESLGGLKTACVLGEDRDIPPGLEVSGLDLQKLFVRLTNDDKVA